MTKNTRISTVLLLIIATAALALHGPIAQFANYHEFADQSVVQGIPHFFDVMSNVGFILVAIWGLVSVSRLSTRTISSGNLLFLYSLLATGIGSTYYHLAPNDSRLVFDRLPIALACAGLLSGLWGEINGRDNKQLTYLLSLFAFLSVAYWFAGTLSGAGDLRPYLLLQGAPMALIPLWLIQSHHSLKNRMALVSALLLYAAAKITEIYDHQLLAVVGSISGHTLKHMFATLASLLIAWRMIKLLEPEPYLMLKQLLALVLKVAFRVTVTGDKNNFHNERTLIVANHESFIDGLLLGLNLPVEATYVVHQQIAERPGFKFLLRFVSHLAVDSTSPHAIKQIVKLVDSGRPVVIFPEGRITKTGSLMKVYDGAAFVAAKTGAAVVPVRIDGAAKSYFGRLAGLYPLKAFPKVTVSILPRTTIVMPDLPTANARRRRAGELMRSVLLNMLVVTRPEKTIYDSFLDGMHAFGRGYKLLEDLRLCEESYGSLLKMALGMQRLILKFTQPNEIVGLLLPSAAVTPALILALSASKRVPAMLNYTAGADGVSAACTAAGIKTIIASRSFVEKAKLETLLAELSHIKIYFLEDLKSQLTTWDKVHIGWNLLFPRSAALPQTPQDPAIVLFTSGSEGKPKGVVHTHSSLLSNVAQIRAVADFNPLDKFMMALPLFHSFGLTCGVLLPLVSGCKVFLYPNPLHYRVIPELIYDRDCTVLFGTSTFLGNYAKFAHPYDFGRLRYVVAGAEKLSAKVHDLWMEKFGIRILEGYGITECAPVVAVNVPMAHKTGSVGQLMPGIEARLDEVPGITNGRALFVRGPNIMKGYLLYSQPGVIQVPESLQSGWYDTGDIVTIDEGGFVHICGRAKRFAKIAGEMVSLEVVEALARATNADATHAASTRADKSKGEAIVLFTTSKDLNRDQLLQIAKQQGVPELAVPREIRLIDALPLLGTGKTDYVELKRWASDEDSLRASSLESEPEAVA